jgi:hypothetical protein
MVWYRLDVGCEVMELELAQGPQAGLARGGTLMKTNHAQSSSDLSLTPHKQYTMDVMDNNQQEIDPLSDPEERRVLYSALDSFR